MRLEVLPGHELKTAREGDLRTGVHVDIDGRINQTKERGLKRSDLEVWRIAQHGELGVVLDSFVEEVAPLTLLVNLLQAQRCSSAIVKIAF